MPKATLGHLVGLSAQLVFGKLKEHIGKGTIKRFYIPRPFKGRQRLEVLGGNYFTHILNNYKLYFIL